MRGFEWTVAHRYLSICRRCAEQIKPINVRGNLLVTERGERENARIERNAYRFSELSDILMVSRRMNKNREESESVILEKKKIYIYTNEQKNHPTFSRADNGERILVWNLPD